MFLGDEGEAILLVLDAPLVDRVALALGVRLVLEVLGEDGGHGRRVVRLQRGAGVDVGVVVFVAVDVDEVLGLQLRASASLLAVVLCVDDAESLPDELSASVSNALFDLGRFDLRVLRANKK